MTRHTHLGPMTWAKQDPNRDIDPSGVMAAAVINLGKAAAMNISYIEFVDRFVKPSREPTVQVILPNRRQLADDAYQLVTAPFRYPVYSILPRVPYCTCWYGVFVEVEATDRDVEITGLFSQSGEYFKDPLDRNNVTGLSFSLSTVFLSLCQRPFILCVAGLSLSQDISSVSLSHVCVCVCVCVCSLRISRLSLSLNHVSCLSLSQSCFGFLSLSID